MRTIRRARANTYYYEPPSRLGPRTSRLLVLGAAVALLGGAAFATNASAAADKDHKVTICHATDSRTNPYVQITVDYHSITQGGHGRHEGPVFDPALPEHTKWGDIIPAFDFGDGASFGGMNASDGADILANGCTVGTATTTTTVDTTTSTGSA